MKKNDTVEYLGCSDEQVRWGNNDDPRSFLIVGKEYRIEKVDVRSQHTKIKLYNKMGWFNSVCFQVTNSELNTYSNYKTCLLYTSPSPRDVEESRMPSSA